VDDLRPLAGCAAQDADKSSMMAARSIDTVRRPFFILIPPNMPK
jgi:hypothetical protein